MANVWELGSKAAFSVEKIGGIDETTIEIDEGVTVLTGRNATNRTSFLQAVVGALGGTNVSVKGDADRGRATLEVDGEVYERTFTRGDDGVVATGEGYLEDPEVAELFAFLLGNNEARRAVVQGADLREIIMRPVDTDAIKREIRDLEHRRDEIDEQLEELEQVKRKLPELQEDQTQLEKDINEKREKLAEKESEIEAADSSVQQTRKEKDELESKLADLRETRQELEEVRQNISTQEDSIASLRSERNNLETDLAELPEMPMGEYEDIESRIQSLRDEKRRLDAQASELQSIIQFNEEMLDDREPIVESLTESDEGGELTDQLLADSQSITCWTCGSEVEPDTVEATLDQLRTIRQEKFNEINKIESDLDDLESRQQKLEQQQREREHLERRIEETDEEITRRKERLETLQDRRENLTAEIETLQEDVDSLESEDFGEIFELQALSS